MSGPACWSHLGFTCFCVFVFFLNLTLTEIRFRSRAFRTGVGKAVDWWATKSCTGLKAVTKMVATEKNLRLHQCNYLFEEVKKKTLSGS